MHFPSDDFPLSGQAVASQREGSFKYLTCQSWLKQVRGNTSCSVQTTGVLHADNILSFQPEKIYITHLEKETINFKN